MTPPLGAEHRVLLLRTPDEHHPLRCGEALQALLHDVVLPLTPGEVDPLNALGLGEPMHSAGEPVADLAQRRRRRDPHIEPAAQVADDPGRVLQLWLVHVQIHPVDALHLEHRVFGQDICHAPRYRHLGLRSDG